MLCIIEGYYVNINVGPIKPNRDEEKSHGHDGPSISASQKNGLVAITVAADS